MSFSDDPDMLELFKKYSLSAETLADEDEVRQNVANNLSYFMHKYKSKDQKGMSQRDMAELLGIGAPQLTRILHKEQTPTVFNCLDRAKRIFHYSIDELLYTDIERTERLIHDGEDPGLPVASYMKFLGLYQMYYFDTSAFKGRERTSNEEAIRSGILYVEKDHTTDKHKVFAIFNLCKDDADNLYRNALMNGSDRINCHDKIISMSGRYHVYLGELDLSERHVYVNLHFENSKDRVQMILHRPESNSNQYIGGLGSMISVSKGRNASPCVQHIALSNKSLYVSEEELAAHLLMHYPNIKTHGSIDEAVNLAVDLYTGDYPRLSNEHKKELVEKEVDRIVNDTIEKNLFRTVVVSPQDDDEFYHYLKRVRVNN